jgi:adenylate cyclase
MFRLAVGFVDLVGFTPYVQDAEAEELAGFVESFEAQANDVVASRGGRVVKHIGDEVMFVEADPVTACDIALRLVDSFGSEAGVMPHAGVGFGPLVARGGDYYGSVVNVASRIADIAVPGEVLATEALERAAAGADSGMSFEPAGRRMLKGFGEPIPLWSVRRSHPAP